MHLELFCVAYGVAITHIFFNKINLKFYMIYNNYSKEQIHLSLILIRLSFYIDYFVHLSFYITKI